jgi:hypothetical protein
MSQIAVPPVPGLNNTHRWNTSAQARSALSTGLEPAPRQKM